MPGLIQLPACRQNDAYREDALSCVCIANAPNFSLFGGHLRDPFFVVSRGVVSNPPLVAPF